eukprot:2326381-Ditylum_brightwellii.AAC.1
MDRDEIERLCKEENKIENNHCTVQEAVKQQVPEVVDDMYLCQIKNKYAEYMGVLIQDILPHILNWYVKITPKDPEDYNESFKEGIDMSEPIDA